MIQNLQKNELCDKKWAWAKKKNVNEANTIHDTI